MLEHKARLMPGYFLSKINELSVYSNPYLCNPLFYFCCSSAILRSCSADFFIAAVCRSTPLRQSP